MDEGIIDINHTLVYYDHRDESSKTGRYFNVHTPKMEAGVSIKMMQDTLGHADISATLNIYADVTRELKKSEFAGRDTYFETD